MKKAAIDLRRLRFSCPKCGDRFKTAALRDLHLSSSHDVYVSFRSLVGQDWGRIFKTKAEAQAFAKNPGTDALQLGCLLALLAELSEVKFELRRVRTLR